MNEKYKEVSLKDLSKVVSQIASSVNEMTTGNDARDIKLSDLQMEVNHLKKEIRWLKSQKEAGLLTKGKGISIQEPTSPEESEDEEEEFANMFYQGSSSLHKIDSQRIKPSDPFLLKDDRVIQQKYYMEVNLIIAGDYSFKAIALFDTGADLNCLSEGLVPSRFFSKTAQMLNTANGGKLIVEYKISDAVVCNNSICVATPFLLVKNMTQEVILGHPFISQLVPYQVDFNGIQTNKEGRILRFDFLQEPKAVDINGIISKKENFLFSLKEEIDSQRIRQAIQATDFQDKLKAFQNNLEREICSDIPNAFWDRKRHVVTLPYEEDFDERQIPTKARPIQMNDRHLKLCHEEIQSLLKKGLIRKSYSPWSCPAFYVENAAELERGVPRLVINYKPLNRVLKWIRYPIPNKRDLLNRLLKAKIYSKFDLKSGYWQIQIKDTDCYKTAFTVPFGHYEWLVQPFGLKNAPSDFQRIMNEIFNPYMDFIIVYIDDILVFSQSIEQHWKHLNIFQGVAKREGLVISSKKVQLFQTNIRFLGFLIDGLSIQPINRAIQFADKFPDEIKEKQQLQRFLGSLNYVADFYKDLARDAAPLYKRLKKNPGDWNNDCSNAVKKIKFKVKELPCLNLSNPEAFKIIETDASDKGYGGILKQKSSLKEELVRYTSGIWNPTQSNYSTIKKEILSIVLCISKFQDDILNQKFLLRIDCKSAKDVLEKDVKNIASKQIFARWQAILSVFEFDIEFIKGENNSLPDFLTREFLLETPIFSILKDQLTVCALTCRSPPRRSSKPAYEKASSSTIPTPSPKIQKNKGKGIAIEPPPCDYFPAAVRTICIIDYTDESKPIEEVAAKFLSNSLEFPGDFPKTRKFYEKILEETGSASIIHKYRDSGNLAFSSLNVKKVISLDHWRKDAKKPIPFREISIFPNTYNYFDYIKAWEQVFIYQNQTRTHSWFIAPKLNHDFVLEEFPAWFGKWFLQFGLQESCIPDSLTPVLKAFRETYSGLSKDKSLFAFSFLYSVPWILQWSLCFERFTGIDYTSLSRQFHVKWWAKYDPKPIFSDWVEIDSIPSPAPAEKSSLKEILKGFSKEQLEDYLKDIDKDEDDPDRLSQTPPRFF